MASKLQLEITENLDTKKEIIANFELNAEIVAGSLKSNAKELSKQIENELKNYSVEKYINNPDAAKTDKALLNKVKEAVSEKRKEIQKTWNKPLDDFLDEMKNLEKSISNASEQINSIVKDAENQEKNNKKTQIENYWSTLDFKIVPLERIFNPKWLNKTYKLEQVMKDCEEIIEKITSELSTIKSMNDEDVEILQSFYIETLNLNATLTKGNQLKANRSALKEAEKKTNPETVRNAIDDANDEWKKSKLEQIQEVKTAIIEHSKTDNDSYMTYTLYLGGPKSKLIALRKYLELNGITFRKINKGI